MIRPNGANNNELESRTTHYHIMSIDMKAVRHNYHNRILESDTTEWEIPGQLYWTPENDCKSEITSRLLWVIKLTKPNIIYQVSHFSLQIGH